MSRARPPAFGGRAVRAACAVLTAALVLATAPWGMAGAQAGAPRGVESVPGLRVVSLQPAPNPPAFGEPFVLHVVLRARADLLVALPDTLLPTVSAQSAGAGTWTRAPAPGDSVDFSAAYPVIGFREGVVEYPWLGLDLGSELRYLRLGGIALTPFTPLDERGLGSPPRPPADVLGGGWSAWRVVAVGLLALAGAGVLGLMGRSGLDRRQRWLAGRLVPDPRADALRELERVFAAGWHRNGRVADFYACTGDALRGFVASRDPEFGVHLTSTELLERLGARTGTRSADHGERGSSTETIALPLRTGERVKFGGHRPDPETAEGHWRAVRDWIRDLPGP